MKQNKPYLRIFNMLLILAAYGYLAYRLIIFDDYASFFAAFQDMDIWHCLTPSFFNLIFPLLPAKAGPSQTKSSQTNAGLALKPALPHN